MPITATDFPPPRVRRSGGTPASAAAYSAPPPPRSRVFSFAIQTTAGNVRSSTSSPLLLGPAIIKGIHISKNGAANGGLGFGIGKALSPVTEVSVSSALPLPFESLFTGLPQIGLPPTAPNSTDVVLDVQPSLMLDDDSLGILVLEPEFYLVVFASNGNVAGGPGILGHVNVVEQVSPDVVANFR